MGDENSDIRAAERALEQGLAAEDPLAWVDHYCDDAVFVAPNAPMVRGRAALKQMARSMQPLSSVSITPQRTELSLGTKPEVNMATGWLAALLVGLLVPASLLGLIGSARSRRHLASSVRRE